VRSVASRSWRISLQRNEVVTRDDEVPWYATLGPLPIYEPSEPTSSDAILSTVSVPSDGQHGRTQWRAANAAAARTSSSLGAEAANAVR